MGILIQLFLIAFAVGLASSKLSSKFTINIALSFNFIKHGHIIIFNSQKHYLRRVIKRLCLIGEGWEQRYNLILSGIIS